MKHPTQQKVNCCLHLSQMPCSSEIKGEGKKMHPHHLINSACVDVNIRHAHGKNVRSIGVRTWTG
jgi:hypothetical protein